MRAVMLDLLGLELQQEEQELLQHPQVGGIILFSRNYQTPAQLRDLIRQIRAIKREPLLIAVDHEGGRVQRFRAGFTALPALGRLGQLYETQPEPAAALIAAHAWLMAAELRAVDIDFSFAPVLDLDKNISQVIGDRALSASPAIVSELATLYIKNMQRAGMAAVGKHFPGHGSVAPDSHLTLPIDERSLATIEQADLIPFAHLIRAGLAGMMPAHIVYSQVDAQPVCFSTYWLQQILREQLKFAGAIFSDDLSMAGAQQLGTMSERARAAFAAGCDMVLVCNDRAATITTLEFLEKTNYQSTAATLQRLTAMRGQSAPTRAELQKSSAWQTAVTMLENFNQKI